MVNEAIIRYVKEQLHAGYSHEEIEGALHQQGWSREDILDAFDQARDDDPKHHPAPHEKPHKPEPEHHKDKKKEEKPKMPGEQHNAFLGFVLSIIGGVIIFIFALEQMLDFTVVSSLIPTFSLVGLLNILEASLFTGIVSLILSFIIIIFGFITYKKQLGGSLVLIISVIALIAVNGTLIIVGGIFGVIGGILGLLRK